MKFFFFFTALLALLSPCLFAEELEVGPESAGWGSLYDPPFKKPQEIPTSNPDRKKLFDMLRPKLEKHAKQPILFQGGLYAYRNWALFQGDTVDENGDVITFPDDGNSDTVALWLNTAEGWKLVDYESGHTDLFYMIWIEKYGMPRKLLFRGE